MSETPKRYPPKLIAYIAFLVVASFFTSMLTGMYMYHHGDSLTVALVSSGIAFVVVLCGIVVLAVRLSKLKKWQDTMEMSETPKKYNPRLRWLFFVGAIAGIYLIPHELIHAFRLAKGSPQQIGAFLDIAIYVALTCYFLRLWWKSRHAPDSK